MRFQFTLRNTAFISTLLTCGADVKADTIVAGTQYQLSTSGQEDLGFGLISTTGKPIGPGNTSFVIRRLADATLDPATAAVVPIQMIAVSLQSTAPVTVNGGLYNFFVHLTPGKLSLGTETIVETNPNLAPFQGWFTLDTKPYITVDFTPVGAGTAFSKDLQLTLTSSLTRWRHQPQAGEVVVSGSADPILDNCHDPHNGCSRDFFIDGGLVFPGVQAGAVAEQRNAEATPEPGSAFLLGSGLLLTGWALRARRRR